MKINIRDWRVWIGLLLVVITADTISWFGFQKGIFWSIYIDHQTVAPTGDKAADLVRYEDLSRESFKKLSPSTQQSLKEEYYQRHNIIK